MANDHMFLSLLQMCGMKCRSWHVFYIVNSILSFRPNQKRSKMLVPCWKRRIMELHLLTPVPLTIAYNDVFWWMRNYKFWFGHWNYDGDGYRSMVAENSQWYSGNSFAGNGETSQAEERKWENYDLSLKAEYYHELLRHTMCMVLLACWIDFENIQVCGVLKMCQA